MFYICFDCTLVFIVYAFYWFMPFFVLCVLTTQCTIYYNKYNRQPIGYNISLLRMSRRNVDPAALNNVLQKKIALSWLMTSATPDHLRSFGASRTFH